MEQASDTGKNHEMIPELWAIFVMLGLRLGPFLASFNGNKCETWKV